MFVTCLQDFPCDKLVTGFTLHPKEALVVLFAIRRAVLADVFSGKDLPAGLAFKAAQMPLLFQRQQRLSVLDIPSTASAIAGARGFFRAGRHRLCTELAKAVSPIERDSVSGWKRALADGTSKAVGMVGLAQGGHHLSFHELPAAVAACPIHSLVVQRAQILSVLYEEAPLGQVTAAHFAGETFDVEMFGLDPKHFALAWLPTFVAVNDRLLWRVVRVLGVSHPRGHGSGSRSRSREGAGDTCQGVGRKIAPSRTRCTRARPRGEAAGRAGTPPAGHLAPLGAARPAGGDAAGTGIRRARQR